MTILIAHASAGNGHKSAAEALANACKKQGIEDEVVLIDALDYTSAFCHFLYPRLYMFLVNKIPYVWAFFYYLIDNPVIYRFFKGIRRIGNVLNSRRMIILMKALNPRIILVTHFLPLDIAMELKKRGDITSKVVPVVTDFFAHSFWIYPDADEYIVASDISRAYLAKREVAEEKIKVKGIPIHERFSFPVDRDAVRAQVGLDPSHKTVLICGGGFGGGPIADLVRVMANDAPEVQVMVVCGSNAALKEQLDQFVHSKNASQIHVFGYISNMHELMGIADCIITKPGGLTSSEALAKALPLIIIRPIPGQETGNCRVLVEEGCAVRINSAREVVPVLRRLFIDEPQELERMRAHAQRLSRPHAAGQTIQEIAFF